jgi:hypothetical protein
MMAARDPEPPMALAAATRLSPLGQKSPLINGVLQVVKETTKHPMIARCISLITDSAFSPEAINNVRGHAKKYIIRSRREYTLALRQNLQALLDGSIAPRHFVSEFFELTEAGNMRSVIRKKLVLSLLLSENIRPSIKFLFLENFEELPQPVRKAIIGEIMKAEPSRHMELLKEELHWMTSKSGNSIEALVPQNLQKNRTSMDQPILNKSKKVQYRPWLPGESSVTQRETEVAWH